jgi:Trk K+ transport system NAD-binding subunit
MAMNDEGAEQKLSHDEAGVHHTFILGWSKKMASLLRQLAVANQSLGGGEITVLAAVELERMEQEYKQESIDMLGTSVRFLCGNRHETEILRKASIDTASAIIVLAESHDADESDQLSGIIVRKIMKVVDAASFKGHIVVEVIDVENEPWIKKAGGDLVETVVAKDVVTRLMVQCARQPGLAQVWRDILGFDKAEFYLKRWPELDGTRFIDVLISFPEAIPCGVKVASRNNKIVLNPDDEYVLAEGDEVLVIADDDDSYAPSSSLPEVHVIKHEASEELAEEKVEKKILICGWQQDMEDMISVLEQTLGTGSEVWIFSEVPEEERETRLKEKGIVAEDLENVKLTQITGKATAMKDLEDLPLETFDSILLVADGDMAFHAEQESLSTLIMIKSIQAKRLPYREARAVQIHPAGNSKSCWIDELQHCTAQSIIVSEILNAQTKEAIDKADDSQDIEISDEMVSMALAMVAEDKRISGILDELFAEEGNEMIMRPAEMYLDRDAEELSFYDVMMRARLRKEIVIGYEREDEDQLVINPSNKSARLKWSLDDSFIVLVERH